MKLSELIDELELAYNERGDVDVAILGKHQEYIAIDRVKPQEDDEPLILVLENQE